VFGNIVEEDIRRTIRAVGGMLQMGGTAIWTRHRRPPDLTPSIRQWFAASGFVETAYREVPGSSGTVVANQLASSSETELHPRLFNFVGDGSAAHL
jgi:hypothetical protein